MKRVACPLFVVGAIFACGDRQGGFNDDRPPPLGSDAGADPMPSCEGTVRCARDLRSVVDGCDESRVISACAPDQGCADGKCLPACDAAVGANATMGCEFVALPPPRVALTAGSCFAAVLTNSWEVPAQIEAEYEGKPLDIATITKIVRTDGANTTYEPFDGTIKPGEVAVVFLAEQASGIAAVPCPVGTTAAIRKETAENGTRRGSTFRIKTTAPVSAYSMYPFGGAASAASTSTLLLPLASWKADYIVTSPWEMRYFDANDPYFPTTQIVAAEDDTEISVIGSVHIAQGADVESAEKGVTKKYRLRRGEQIQFFQEQDLTGTRIGANKQIGVWVGHQGMAIPTTATCCGDSSQTALFPVRSWGREYVAVPYLSRSHGEVPEQYLYKITGAADGTVLTYEPSQPKDAPSSLAAGESLLFMTQEPFIVRSQDIEHPIALFSYMTGEAFPQAQGYQGDPEFVPVIPTEQYLGRYVFFADTSYPNSQLVVVRSREEGKDFEPVVLDCAGPLEGWKPVGTSGKQEYTRIWLTRFGNAQQVGSGTCGTGRREIDSRGPIAVTVWGTHQFASYGYPGGAALRTINAVESIVK
ncbi:MAG: hypothetical protein BGO98_27890 [Myxococcales bacterium 68-20]|nr:IgGFc-binding protein [Myxococcales bacterium]OJY30534.1 MAG: hypothetical protein BGO98_27890 [Myxococcales bacterium 68-20]